MGEVVRVWLGPFPLILLSGPHAFEVGWGGDRLGFVLIKWQLFMLLALRPPAALIISVCCCCFATQLYNIQNYHISYLLLISHGIVTFVDCNE